jgi:hypothetical protein
MSASAHDFDFWIGDWDVYGPLGKPAGRNTITPMFEGQSGGMLHEHWHGNGGVEGRSINAYDASRGCWHQTWMDSTGGVLLLEGGLRDGAMVLEGWGPGDDDDLDRVDRQRITWTRDDEGAEVRQLWESSSDDGKTWTVAFDGRYRRRVAE